MDALEMQTDVQIRFLIRRDLPEVCWIEERSYGQPWSQQDFLRCLRQRSTIGVVADDGQQVIGYAIYDLSKDTVDVLCLAVHPAFRRRGIGRQIVWYIKRRMTAKRPHLEATLTERNLAGQQFLKAMQFRVIEILPQLYDEETDGYRFRFFSEWTYASND